MNIFGKVDEIPRLNKALLPTPLEHLHNLSAETGCNIYMKRDDLTGHSFGGNKERKLDYIIKDAISKGKRTLLTVGAPHSNHCRMTAALGAAYGMKVELILISDDADFDHHEGNLMLDILFDAKIHIVPPQKVQSKIDELTESIDDLYFIEGGGHCVLGLIAYVDAARELKLQCEKAGVFPKYIVLPCGTGTTQAGIAMGCALLEWDVYVMGMSIARSSQRCREEIDSICLQGCDYLEIPRQSFQYAVNDNFIGDGYGKLYQDCIDTLGRVAKLDGVVLDPVYNAKTMTGLLAEIESGNVTDAVVYWNTGGQPALFIDKYRGQLC